MLPKSSTPRQSLACHGLRKLVLLFCFSPKRATSDNQGLCLWFVGESKARAVFMCHNKPDPGLSSSRGVVAGRREEQSKNFSVVHTSMLLVYSKPWLAFKTKVNKEQKSIRTLEECTCITHHLQTCVCHMCVP